jgi:hypothetical protein
MTRTLTENIARGRQAIALAQRKSIDTASWEESLADLERQEILCILARLAGLETQGRITIALLLGVILAVVAGAVSVLLGL